MLILYYLKNNYNLTKNTLFQIMYYEYEIILFLALKNKISTRI